MPPRRRARSTSRAGRWAGAKQFRPSKVEVEPLADEPAKGAEAHRPEPNDLGGGGRKRAVDLEGHAAIFLADAAGEEERDVDVAEAPRGESEDATRRRVEPLRVVDRHDNATLGCHIGQDAGQTEPQRSAFGWPFGLPEQKRTLERATLRHRKRLDDRIESPEEVSKGYKPQSGFRAGHRADERHATALSRAFDRFAPESRLADPSLALE